MTLIPRDPLTLSAQDLADPRIASATLAHVAQHRPDLWAMISAHPQCYPELAAWIGARQAATPVQSEPAPSSPRPAPPDAASEGASAQQMAAGAKQFAAGARNFMTTRLTPATVSAAKAVQHSVREQAEQARSETGWTAWLPFGIPAFALVGILGVFFPAATATASGWGFSDSRTSTFFDEDAAGIGVALLLVMILVLVGGVVSMVLKRKPVRIAAAIAGFGAGLFTAIVAFSLIGAASGYSDTAYGFSTSAAVGAGTIILAIASIGLLAASVVALLPVRRKPGGDGDVRIGQPSPSATSEP